jgi:hypothetical protein
MSTNRRTRFTHFQERQMMRVPTKLIDPIYLARNIAGLWFPDRKKYLIYVRSRMMIKITDVDMTGRTFLRPFSVIYERYQDILSCYP